MKGPCQSQFSEFPGFHKFQNDQDFFITFGNCDNQFVFVVFSHFKWALNELRQLKKVQSTKN